MFRKLKPNEIEVRTQSVKPNGAILLLYKDARCDMNILDETVGAKNWERSHSRDNANCTVSIYDEDKQAWVSKEDTGTESNTEKAKGLASDSFKRACFNWGIGRELYTSPFIWVKGTSEELKNAKYECKEIGYNEFGEIDRLVITSKNKIVYEFGNGKQSKKQEPQNKENLAKDLQKNITGLFNDLVQEFGSNDVVYENIGIDRDKFVEMYKSEPDKLWEMLKQYA